MKYEKFCSILNKHIFKDEQKELLRKIVDSPERFIGLFRPTKPGAKILQNLLQSHEIRMGDALEEIIEEILKDIGFKILPKEIANKKGKKKSLDHHYTDNTLNYFIEQKVRDDHDSSKAPGQMSNFEEKLDILHNIHESKLIGIIYFVDPALIKNKNYYLTKLKELEKFYGVKLYLFYGKELFDYLQRPDIWNNILVWLKQWKDKLPELPEINFDFEPEKGFKELKNLELRYWRKILENEKLWEEGIIKVIFREGKTLKLLLEFFHSQTMTPYKRLYDLLKERISKYFLTE